MNKLIASAYILISLTVVLTILFFILVFTLKVDETMEATGVIENNLVTIPYFKNLNSKSDLELLVNGEKYYGNIVSVDSINIVIRVDKIENSSFEKIYITTNRTKMINVIINTYINRYKKDENKF